MIIKSISLMLVLWVGLGILGCGRVAPQPAAEQRDENHGTGEVIQAVSDDQPQLAPESAAVYSSRCRALYQEARFDLAITDCSQAIELDPRAADAYLHRGLAFRDKGQTPEAVRDLEVFLQLSDNPMDRMQVERLVNKLR